MRSFRFAAAGVCVAVAACAPRPVELGFWLTPLSYQSPRIGAPITQTECALIDKVARAEVVNAFRAYDVRVTVNRSARYKVAVVPTLKDWRRLTRPGTYAGESRAVAGFGGAGAVNFEYVANGAMVFAPEDASRAQVIDAVGRGIGRVAIHEFAHQLLPKQPIDGSSDRRSYEGNTAAMAEGYYGDLHWDIARPWLDARLKEK